ncbi:MAG TPA: hypothetical protein DGG95_01385, partial [Cytophagales bacterium]|nr:hypothetical protein [Cytophagales bacterium]
MRLNYKPLMVFAALLFMNAAVQAQNSVSIGTTTTNQRAVLLLVGNNQGLVIPTVGNPTNINAQASDAGMIVYNTTDKLVYYYNGTQWTSLGGSGSASQAISIAGNVITVGTGGTTANISSAAPSTKGQFFMWDGTAWTATSITGDVSSSSSTNGSLTVTGIQGKGVTLPSSGVQYLAYDATQGKWVFQTPSGSVPTLANGQLLTGNGTINSATTLAGDGSLIGGTLTVSGLQGKNLPALPTSTVFPVQLLSFNGTNNSWEFKDLIGANIMTKTVYDPTGKSADAFDLTKHTGWPANASGFLTNNGTGTLSWSTPSGTVPTLANGQILTGNGTTNSATTLAGDATLSGGTLTIS